MYRSVERRDNNYYPRRKKQKRLQRKIIGFCLFTFLLGYLCGRVVLAAEHIFMEPDWKTIAGASAGELPDASAKEKDLYGWNEAQGAGNSGKDEWGDGPGTMFSGDYGQDEAWNLRLVNFENPLPEDFTVELTEVGEGHQVDSRIAQALLDMIAAGKRDGYQIWIASSYRTMQKQTSLFENKVANLKREGYSETEARREAGTVVAVPGTSEHQLGLAVDLVSSEYTGLDERQEQTRSYQWLVKHCAEYGFILRYPNGKTGVTGIIYEPWHFRYVGKEAAAEIMEQGICLEEYLEQRS